MVKSIGPDHETATLMREPLESEPWPRVASSPARCAPADEPKAPIFFGSMRNEATCAGWRSQRIAARTSSTPAGYGCSGASR